MRFDTHELPPTADYHSHLRDGAMMETVVSSIRHGGVDTVLARYVPTADNLKPNLTPPITTVAAAISYRDRLRSLVPDVAFLMTLYLHPSITPATIDDAARAGITGVKVYPAGVTTNSEEGVIDFRQYYPVFEAMSMHNMVLNLHGETPNTPDNAYTADASADFVTIRNAEEKFLPTLRGLHSEFPNLRIVLEHCSTQEALDAVRACGPTVAATITAHHLWITQDDWCGNTYNFCKPVAKDTKDRVALIQAAVGKEGKFFFGSDSAPHTACAKNRARFPSWVLSSLLLFFFFFFTQGYATALVVEAVEEAVKNSWIEGEVTEEALEGLLSGYGRKFYKMEDAQSSGGKQRIILERKGERISQNIRSTDGSIEVVPFRSGEETLSVRWKL